MGPKVQTNTGELQLTFGVNIWPFPKGCFSLETAKSAGRVKFNYQPIMAKYEVSQITGFMILSHLGLVNELPKIEICDQISQKRGKSPLGYGFPLKGPLGVAK